MSDWPIIERPLCDHLSARTNFRWSVEGGRTITSPLGVAQVVGGSNSLDVDANPNVEITLHAATREGLWVLARQVSRVFAALNPGPIGDTIWVDEAREAFALKIDPDLGTATYKSATVTYVLTLRPQGEPEITVPDAGEEGTSHE